MTTSRSADENENESAMFAERMRGEEGSRAEIELAAFLGHPAARQVLRTEAASYYGSHEPILVLAPWGKAVCLRAAITAVRAAATLLDIKDEVVEADLECADRGVASGRPSPTVIDGLSLEGHLREASWTVAEVSASEQLDWASRLDDAIGWMISGTYGKLRLSGRWSESVWSQLSPVFPMPREEGEGGVWRAAVLASVSASLIPWVLKREK